MNTLLPEILGFSPQLLLDDIINITQSSITDSVNAMEAFLRRWADERVEGNSTQEVEQGLVQFQTLLEYHTDIAFDFFEAWSLRNIFAFPADVGMPPVVVPHQSGLDLTQRREREDELMDEIGELRRKIDNQRRLYRLYTRAVYKAKGRERRSKAELERVEFLSPETLEGMNKVTDMLMKMYGSASKLPGMDSKAIGELLEIKMSEAGKREWEESDKGYLKWAVERLIERFKSGIEEENIGTIGELEDLKKIVNT